MGPRLEWGGAAWDQDFFLHCIHSLVSSFQLYNERPGKTPASFPGHSHILSHSCEEKPTVIKCPGNEAYVVLFPDPVQYLVLKSLRDVFITNLLVAPTLPQLCFQCCAGGRFSPTAQASDDCSLLVYACILNVVSLMNCWCIQTEIFLCCKILRTVPCNCIINIT